MTINDFSPYLVYFYYLVTCNISKFQPRISELAFDTM